MIRFHAINNKTKSGFKKLDTSRKTVVTVRVAQRPLLVHEVRLRRRLDVEKRSGVLRSLLSAAECVRWFAAVCRKQQFKKHRCF